MHSQPGSIDWKLRQLSEHSMHSVATQGSYDSLGGELVELTETQL